MPSAERRWVAALSLALTTLSGCASKEAARPLRRDGPHRVISLVPAATDFIVALGATGRLVGRTDYDRDPRLSGVPSVGGAVDPSVERIASLRPDLIISWQDVESPAIGVQMRLLRLPVRRVRMETLADVREAVRDLGRWLGCEAKADSMLQALRDTLDAVRWAAARRPPVTVFFLVQLDPPITAGPGTFVDELLTLAGARNVFADTRVQWPAVALESIARRDPDLVIWPRGADDRPWRDELRSLTAWLAVPAVRDGRVLVVDRDLFAKPGPMLGLAARRLAQALESLAHE